MLKKILIVLVLIVVIFSIHQMFTAREVTRGSLTTVTFTGVSLNCPDCQTKARQALSNILGIRTSQISPKRGMIRVTFNANIMKANWIAHSLRASGLKPGHVKIEHSLKRAR